MLFSLFFVDHLLLIMHPTLGVVHFPRITTSENGGGDLKGPHMLQTLAGHMHAISISVSSCEQGSCLCVGLCFFDILYPFRFLEHFHLLLLSERVRFDENILLRGKLSKVSQTLCNFQLCVFCICFHLLQKEASLMMSEQSIDLRT